MIVVSDTTPLISLMKIGKLDLVNHLFGEVQIPNAVYEELVILHCIEILKTTGRHISERLYKQLMEKMSDIDA